MLASRLATCLAVEDPTRLPKQGRQITSHEAGVATRALIEDLNYGHLAAAFVSNRLGIAAHLSDVNAEAFRYRAPERDRNRQRGYGIDQRMAVGSYQGDLK